MKALFTQMRDWSPPDNWKRIVSLDAHTGGEPLRIIVQGFPGLRGDTMLERRRFAKEHHDDLRKSLMWEPRGHREMYGCIMTSPVTKDAHFGVLFTHNDGFSTMCGHGIIAVAMAAVQTGLVKQQNPETVVRIDTPAGLVTAFVESQSDRVRSVSFDNVPSYVVALNDSIEVPGLGHIRYDLAFGGAYYAYVDAGQIGLSLKPEEYQRMIDAGRAIKRAVMKKKVIRHPFDEEMSFLYGTILIARSENKDVHSRNVCVFAEGEVDRSPTGTGVSGRLAIHFAKREIRLHETIAVESITGSVFKGAIVKEAKFGDHEAVVPRIEGTASFTGRHEFFIDPEDPLKEGFLLS